MINQADMYRHLISQGYTVQEADEIVSEEEEFERLKEEECRHEESQRNDSLTLKASARQLAPNNNTA